MAGSKAQHIRVSERQKSISEGGFSTFYANHARQANICVALSNF
ncbi:hypothetical protein EPYR_00045 [Erwinia pyrifoliae DSM 12163]|nr:hypothetical protein EPYR_00045 [Erwinia pyrifoliae DSM 12163]